MEIVPATPERWDDLADLFTRRGPRGGLQMTAGCWCMWWRRRAGDGGRNRAALRRLGRGDYMGVPSMFDRLGFEAVRRAGPRTIVRLPA